MTPANDTHTAPVLSSNQLGAARRRLARSALDPSSLFARGDCSAVMGNFIRHGQLLDGGLALAAIERVPNVTALRGELVRVMLSKEMWDGRRIGRLEFMLDAVQRRFPVSAELRELRRWFAAERLIRASEGRPALRDWSRLAVDVIDQASATRPDGLGRIPVGGAVRLAEVAARSEGDLRPLIASLRRLCSSAGDRWWSALVSSSVEQLESDVKLVEGRSIA